MEDGFAGGDKVDAVHEQNAVFAGCERQGVSVAHGANDAAGSFVVASIEPATGVVQGLGAGDLVVLSMDGDFRGLLVAAEAQQEEQKEGNGEQTLHSERFIGGLSYEKKTIRARFCGDFGRNVGKNVGS